MKTLPLVLLLGAVLTALYVLYLRREGRQDGRAGGTFRAHDRSVVRRGG